MVITVHGTKRGNHGAVSAALLCASVDVFRANRKVLFIPLCDSAELQGEDVEYLAIGKVDKRNDFMDGIMNFNDAGIDALLRRAEAGRLTVEHFDNCTTPVTKAKNHFDIAGMTSEPNFEASAILRIDAIKQLIRSAQFIYDDVIIYMRAKNETLINQIDTLADRTIIVVRQGATEEMFNQEKPQEVDEVGAVIYDDDDDDDDEEVQEEATAQTRKEKKEAAAAKKNEAKHYVIMCTDYEAESKWNAGYLKKAYGGKIIFTCPHNVMFKDAIIGGSIVPFAEQNRRVKKLDNNYDLIANITRMMNHVLEIKIHEDMDELEIERGPERKSNLQLREVEEGDIKVVEQEVKTGWFSKPKIQKTVKTTENGKSDKEIAEMEKERKKQEKLAKKQARKDKKPEAASETKEKKQEEVDEEIKDDALIDGTEESEDVENIPDEVLDDEGKDSGDAENDDDSDSDSDDTADFSDDEDDLGKDSDESEDEESDEGENAAEDGKSQATEEDKPKKKGLFGWVKKKDKADDKKEDKRGSKKEKGSDKDKESGKEDKPKKKGLFGRKKVEEPEEEEEVEVEDSEDETTEAGAEEDFWDKDDEVTEEEDSSSDDDEESEEPDSDEDEDEFPFGDDDEDTAEETEEEPESDDEEEDFPIMPMMPEMPKPQENAAPARPMTAVERLRAAKAK